MDEQERVFRIWAPIGVTWTQWAKPVLFTRVTTDGAVGVIEATELTLPPSDGRSVVVVDMPAIESIRVGVALAGRGYRPVPLFNALPGPSHEYVSTPTPAAVDLHEVPTALTSAANALASLQLPATAPPAFLLRCQSPRFQRSPLGRHVRQSIGIADDRFPVGQRAVERRPRTSGPDFPEGGTAGGSRPHTAAVAGSVTEDRARRCNDTGIIGYHDKKAHRFIA